MLFNYFRIGGVNGDLNHEFMSRLGDWMSRATEQITPGNGLLNENEIFVRRMRGLGTIDTATALRMCMTGPNLRATGVPFDIRRAHPYWVYPELEFDIPTRNEGDCLARYLLRMDEIKQSLRIIDQCLHQMPDGPVMAKLPRLLRPRPGRAYAPSRARAASTRRTRSVTARTSRSGCASTTLVHPPPGGRVMVPRPPRRRHHGGDGLPRPDHGRSRQVIAVMAREGRAEPPDPPRQGRLHAHPVLSPPDAPRSSSVDRAVRRQPIRRHPDREPGDRPVRRRGHDHPAAARRRSRS